VSKFYADPLQLEELRGILETIPVNREKVWQLPWGTTRDQVLDLVSPQRAEMFRSSQSPTLMGYDAIMGARTVRITFIFPNGELDEVHFEPVDTALLDARPLFNNRYGRPSSERSFPGLLDNNERHTAWKAEGYEVELSQNDNGGMGFSFRRPHA
jgi:hypothetical protein